MGLLAATPLTHFESRSTVKLRRILRPKADRLAVANYDNQSFLRSTRKPIDHDLQGLNNYELDRRLIA